MSNIPFAFFGSSSFSRYILDELEQAGFVPKVVVTMPDKPKGRHLAFAPTEVKLWAQERNIPVLTPETLKDPSFETEIKKFNADVFIVASYGKIIPENILYLPKRKTLNVHPSLLPKYRGASPVQSMILADERHGGVTIMELDKEMDQGPILVSKELPTSDWLIYEEKAKEILGHEGGRLLASILPEWIAGTITPKVQDHSQATYTKKINKEDGLIDLSGDPRQNYLKILAYHTWPRAYFFDTVQDKRIRLVVTAARFEDSKLVIEKVIPEGKKEMSYADYLRGKK